MKKVIFSLSLLDEALNGTEIDAQSRENQDSINNSVQFADPSSECPGSDVEFGTEGSGDWIILDDASDGLNDRCSEKDIHVGSPFKEGIVKPHLDTPNTEDVDIQENSILTSNPYDASTTNIKENCADNNLSNSCDETEKEVDREKVISSVNLDLEPKWEESVSVPLVNVDLGGNMDVKENVNGHKGSNSSLNKTVMEVQDMSISEVDVSVCRSEGEMEDDPFVPLIYLTGVKGKTFWCQNKDACLEDNHEKKVLNNDQEQDIGDVKRENGEKILSSPLEQKMQGGLEEDLEKRQYHSSGLELVKEGVDIKPGWDVHVERVEDNDLGNRTDIDKTDCSFEPSVLSINMDDELMNRMSKYPSLNEFVEKERGDKGVTEENITPAERENKCLIKGKLNPTEMKTVEDLSESKFNEVIDSVEILDSKETECQSDSEVPCEEKTGFKTISLPSNQMNRSQLNFNDKKTSETRNSCDQIIHSVEVLSDKGISKTHVNTSVVKTDEVNCKEDLEVKEGIKKDEEQTNGNVEIVESKDNLIETMEDKCTSAEVEGNQTESMFAEPWLLYETNTDCLQGHLDPSDIVNSNTDLSVSMETDQTMSDECTTSTNVTSTPNKECSQFAKPISMNISVDIVEEEKNKLDFLPEDSLDRGEGLRLLMRTYDNNSGSESFNSSAESSMDHNLSGIKAHPEEDSWTEMEVRTSGISNEKISSDRPQGSGMTDTEEPNVCTGKEHLEEAKTDDLEEIETQRDADSSFDAEQRLEDIMSVICDSQQEKGEEEEESLGHYRPMKARKISGSECDLCDDQLCLAKVKCLAGPLDPLEEAMLSSGILDIHDIPVGSVIEIDSDETMDQLEINSKNVVFVECKRNQVCSSYKCAELSGISPDSKSIEQCVKKTEKIVGRGTGSDFLISDDGVEEEDSVISIEDSGHSSSTETDYISDSIDSEGEELTRGDDLSKLIVSEFFQVKQLNKSIDTVCKLSETTTESLISNRECSEACHQEFKVQKEVDKLKNSAPSKSLATSCKNTSRPQLKKPGTGNDVRKKNQNIVRPLAPKSKDVLFPSSQNLPSTNLMYSMSFSNKLMMQNFNFSSPQTNVLPSYQLPVSPLMVEPRFQSLPLGSLFPHTQFQPFSAVASQTGSLLYPYTNYPTRSQVSQLLPLQALCPFPTSPSFELTNDRFEAFRRMNNAIGIEPRFQSPPFGSIPMFGSINVARPMLQSSSVTPSNRPPSFYVNRNVTPERSVKIISNIRGSPGHLTSEQSHLLPPISSFTQRKVVDNRSGEMRIPGNNKLSPSAINVPKQQHPTCRQPLGTPSHLSLYDSGISTQIHSGRSLQTLFPPSAAMAPLDMTISAKTIPSSTGEEKLTSVVTPRQQGRVGAGRNLFECFNQSGNQSTVTLRDKVTSGKIPVGHVRPMSFSSCGEHKKD